ncbi:NAD-dependent deacetylase sirtuin-2 [Pleomassaria siparia CBS 279.74]|uniref:NAD-dependent protein deacetylase n=1 Tax=Pleomassaria siparia CBS 279.74 TaxID=1314801 RepID=A0A6G1KET2_9PLEO|nr:NAD-dependent deacetylase sirtuin-2 [Pleomassaria siparia CBS 279.74]
MGNEQSAIDENTPTQTLDSRTVEAVGKYIKDGRAKRIVVMTGAGISTSAGIPDFRSPGTGLYANLQRLKLPYAEAVFTLDYFRNNPLPFYILAQELYPGQFRPTITHAFINLLNEKGILLKLFTQNIDCLEREAGVPDDKIIEAHGSFANQSCIDCKGSFPKDLMLKAINEKSVPHCLHKSPSGEPCDGLVKPNIVFFGEQLPGAFFDNRDLPSTADLIIVMGTSLSVAPFSQLPSFAHDGTPRVLINSEAVGGLGSRTDDVLMLGDCDGQVRKLAEACGWLEELEAMWAMTAPEKQPKSDKEKAKKSRDEQLQDEVNKLAQEIEENFRLEQAQYEWLDKHTDNKFAKVQEADTSEGDTDIATPIEEAHEANAGSSSALNPDAKKTDPSVGGLEHVFPHFASKSSL